MEQFDSSEEASSRVLEQQQRNDEQQCPSNIWLWIIETLGVTWHIYLPGGTVGVISFPISFRCTFVNLGQVTEQSYQPQIETILHMSLC